MSTRSRACRRPTKLVAWVTGRFRENHPNGRHLGGSKLSMHRTIRTYRQQERQEEPTRASAASASRQFGSHNHWQTPSTWTALMGRFPVPAATS
jgi:hypothetical protein